MKHQQEEYFSVPVMRFCQGRGRERVSVQTDRAWSSATYTMESMKAQKIPLCAVFLLIEHQAVSFIPMAQRMITKQTHTGHSNYSKTWPPRRTLPSESESYRQRPKPWSCGRGAQTDGRLSAEPKEKKGYTESRVTMKYFTLCVVISIPVR